MDYLIIKRDREQLGPYWETCKANNQLYIVVYQKPKYSKIEFDLESFSPRKILKDQNIDLIIDYYNAYCSDTQFPKQYYSYAGGSRNLIMTIHTQDIERFAGGIREIIYKNLTNYLP